MLAGGGPAGYNIVHMNYQSSLRLLGLPLVHVAIGAFEEGHAGRGVARGWIALGDVALGVLVAVGGISCGTLSVGGLSVGLLAVGGLALGGVAVGGAAIGAAACGGLAVGYLVAIGGVACSAHFALGGAAVAPYASSPAAGRGGIWDDLRYAAASARWWYLLVLVPVLEVAWQRLSRR